MIILLCVYIYIYSSCHLIVGVFARKMHSTSEFAMTVLSKQVCDSAMCAQELCTNYGLLKKIHPSVCRFWIHGTLQMFLEMFQLHEKEESHSPESKTQTCTSMRCSPSKPHFWSIVSACTRIITSPFIQPFYLRNCNGFRSRTGPHNVLFWQTTLFFSSAASSMISVSKKYLISLLVSPRLVCRLQHTKFIRAFKVWRTFWWLCSLHKMFRLLQQLQRLQRLWFFWLVTTKSSCGNWFFFDWHRENPVEKGLVSCGRLEANPSKNNNGGILAKMLPRVGRWICKRQC